MTQVRVLECKIQTKKLVLTALGYLPHFALHWGISAFMFFKIASPDSWTMDPTWVFSPHSGLAWFIAPVTFFRLRLQRLLCTHAQCFGSISNRCKSCSYGSALTRQSKVGNYIPQNRQNKNWDVQEEDVWTLQWWGFDHYRDSLCNGRGDIRVFSKWWTRWPTAPVTFPYSFIYLASLSAASLWMMSSQKLVLSKTKKQCWARFKKKDLQFLGFFLILSFIFPTITFCQTYFQPHQVTF